MAGPYCKTCAHFLPHPIVGSGDCTDPEKAIYCRGRRVNTEPEVMPYYECNNHTQQKQALITTEPEDGK